MLVYSMMIPKGFKFSLKMMACPFVNIKHVLVNSRTRAVLLFGDRFLKDK